MPSSFDPISLDVWGAERSDQNPDDVKVRVKVSSYLRKDRPAADKALTGNERGLQSDPNYAAYERLRLTRRLPAITGAGSVAEIEYTRMLDPKVFARALTSGKSIGIHFRPAVPSLRFSLGVEAQQSAEARGVIHWYGYSRSIDRAFVTKDGAQLCVVSVTVAADSAQGRGRVWPKEHATLTTVLNSFRFTTG